MQNAHAQVVPPALAAPRRLVPLAELSPAKLAKLRKQNREIEEGQKSFDGGDDKDAKSEQSQAKDAAGRFGVASPKQSAEPLSKDEVEALPDATGYDAAQSASSAAFNGDVPEHICRESTRAWLARACAESTAEFDLLRLTGIVDGSGSERARVRELIFKQFQCTPQPSANTLAQSTLRPLRALILAAFNEAMAAYGDVVESLLITHEQSHDLISGNKHMKGAFEKVAMDTQVQYMANEVQNGLEIVFAQYKWPPHIAEGIADACRLLFRFTKPSVLHHYKQLLDAKKLSRTEGVFVKSWLDWLEHERNPAAQKSSAAKVRLAKNKAK